MKETARFFNRNRTRITLVAMLLVAVVAQIVLIRAFRQQHSRILVQQCTSVMSDPAKAPIGEELATLAAELNPYDGYTWFHRGTAVYLQQRFDDAIPLLTHSLDYLPHSYNAIRLLAFSHYQMQNFPKAAEEFTRYLTMMPSPAVSPELVFNRAGLAKLRIGDLDDASYYLMQATPLSDSKLDSLRARIMAAVFSNRIGTAQYCTDLFRLYEKETDLNPFEMLANALNAGKMSQAVQYLEAIYPENTNDISVVKALAAAYTRINRTTEARNLISVAIKDNPQDASLHLALGDIYYQEKKYEEAFVHYNEHLSLNPESNFRQDIEQKKAAAGQN